MKVEKLKENMTFKNYKVLCKFLECSVLSGKSKKYQMEELQTYCRIQKSGHSVTVLEVYGTPIEIKEKRGRIGVYNELLPLIITDFLINTQQDVSYITRSDMLKNLAMVNENYDYGSKNVKAISEHTQINEKIIHDFYNTSSSNFKRILETALDKLQSENTIFYNKVYMLSVETTEGLNLIEANDNHVKAILEYSKDALQEMGYDSMNQIRVNDILWNKHNRVIVKKFNEEYIPLGLELNYFYISYKIIVNKKYIEQDHNQMLNDVLTSQERLNRKNELNDIICNRLLESAAKRKEIAHKSKNLQTQIMRNDSLYIQNNQTLIDLLVSSDRAKNNGSLQNAINLGIK